MEVKLALLAAIGGGLGSAARYMVGAMALRAFGPNFPWGTLAVNVAGCCLMGVIAGIALYRFQMSAELRVFLATGFLGGFTTFSAFALDAFTLYEKSLGIAALYVLASVFLSLAAFLFGLAAVKFAS
jgi:CrcB protein